MRKRLRKKKHLKEFTQWGFHLAVQMVGDYDQETALDMAEDGLGPLTRTRGWDYGGGLPRWLFVSEYRTYNQMTEEARDEFCRELAELPTVDHCLVSHLIDAWHGDVDGPDGCAPKVCTIRRPQPRSGPTLQGSLQRDAGACAAAGRRAQPGDKA